MLPRGHGLDLGAAGVARRRLSSNALADQRVPDVHGLVRRDNDRRRAGASGTEPLLPTRPAQLLAPRGERER